MRAECVPPGKARGAEGSGEESGSEVRIAARRAAVLAGCGEVCDFSLPGLPGELFDFVGKRVECGALWNNSALDEEIDQWPPPAYPPPILLDDYRCTLSHHSLSHTLSHSHTLTLTLSHSHTLARLRAHAHTLTLTFAHSHSLTHPHSDTPTLSHSRTITLTLAHSLTITG